MKRISIICICFLWTLGVSSGYAEFDPDTFIRAESGQAYTLDPATSYNVTEAQRIENIYDRLIHFKDSYADQFVPMLATKVPTLENGGISKDGKTYTFTIRKGVRFHAGGEFTPEDVEYSIERTMVVDQDGGPSKMLLEPLTGEHSTRDDDGNIIPGVFEKIINSVQVDREKVIFHLPEPFPPFLQILAQSWAAILDKEWAIGQECWDGTLENAAKYNNPEWEYEPLQQITNGTGPYKMKSWEIKQPGDTIELDRFEFERFEDYWGKKPKLKTAIIEYVPEWDSRKRMLLNGDADVIDVESKYIDDVKNVDGVKLYYIDQLSVATVMFCQDVEPEQQINAIGSGKLDGEGIPPNFFADSNVRKAFMHAFDRKTYLEKAYNNIGKVPTNPNLEGLPYHIDVPVYEYDLEKAKEYMKKAWDGQVWEKGFKMTISHIEQVDAYQKAAKILAENVRSLNPKFQVSVVSDKEDEYWDNYENSRYPIFIDLYSADYPDPHNMLKTFLHSQGLFASSMKYSNSEIDTLIDEGIATVEPRKRAEIYKQLQRKWYEEAIGLCIYQETSIRVYRDWVQGLLTPPNPLDTYASEWLFRLWKGEIK